MRKKLERRIARRDNSDSVGDGKGHISIVNSWGAPIGKRVCIRSMRRANRQFHRKAAKSDNPEWRIEEADVYRRNSSCRVARTVRLLNKQINGVS